MALRFAWPTCEPPSMKITLPVGTEAFAVTAAVRLKLFEDCALGADDREIEDWRELLAAETLMLKADDVLDANAPFAGWLR